MDNTTLYDAALALYEAAYWTPDRECDAVALWTNLRDALGLEPGTHTDVSEASRHC